jgi:hypothetical protein
MILLVTLLLLGYFILHYDFFMMNAAYYGDMFVLIAGV